MAASPLPDPSSDDQSFKTSLCETGIAFQEDFLAEDIRLKLLDRVLEQAEMEIEQGVAQVSDTGTASEMQFSTDAKSVPRFQAVSFLPNKGRVFLDVIGDPRILAYCEAVFAGVPFYLAQQTATIVRRGAAQQVIHTDQQAWPFVTPVPVMLNAVLCLTDFTPEMGSTRFAPGRRGGSPPHIGLVEETGLVGNLEPVETVAPNLSAGSLVMWDGHVWHGQGASASDDKRVVILMTYILHMVRAQDNYAALLHDDVYAALNDEEKRLLGFEVHYEYAGRIAPRNAADRRSNTNFRYPYVPELRREGVAQAVTLGRLNIAHAKFDGHSA